MIITSKGKRWEIINSLWILVTFTLCFFNWIAFLFIGFKTRQKKWVASGVFYSIPFIIAMIQTKAGNFVAYSTLILGIIGIVHAFSIREEYLIRLEAIERGMILTNEEVSHILHKKKMEVLSNLDNDTEQNMYKGTINSKINQPKEIRNISPQEEIKKPSNNTKDRLIDINEASESELAALPGIGLILAKKAISYRENNGNFTSIDNFSEVLNLKPHIAERIKSLVIVSNVKTKNGIKVEKINSNEGVKKEGRIVDF